MKLATNAILPSAISNTSTNGLRDIKPPVAIPNAWVWALGIGAVLVAGVLLFFAWRYWRKRRAMVPPVPVIPAHVRARKKLQEALALIGQPREFCILVSDTIRWYLEERFQFRAPERTTEEFLYELQSTNLLTAAQKQSLGEFLTRCDLVKFARYEPGEPELRDLHASAVRLVDETEPKPEPAPPPLPQQVTPPAGAPTPETTTMSPTAAPK